MAERGIITSAYIAIESVGVMPAYLAWLLRGYDHMKVFYSFGGGVRQSLTFADLKRLPTVLPPEGTQCRIADYLDRETATIDALIEKQRQLVDGLHERSEALVRSGVFGQEQGAARADRWIPNLPAGWSIEPLRRHTALVNGSTPNRANSDYWQGGQHAWLNSSHANSDVVVAADQWVTDAAVEECHLPRLCPGTVLVAITGQGKTRGKATLLTIRATINQHLAGILPEARQWDARFLTLMLRAAYDELRLISDAGGSTRGALTLSSLGNVLVARPSLAEQREIADHLDRETAKIDALIAKAERFIELAQERRAALITAAVTGQIEIPTED
ncbi:restriction endonuclease subunit S [Micrococcus terreus]|uniref:restriction endonuclease subunit S n=1 Tax=Micrococcus terreus TaxID=574650 RepID=UPI003019D344